MREVFEGLAMIVAGIVVLVILYFSLMYGIAALHGTIPCTGWGCTDLWFQECMETERYTREECVELVNDRSTGRR